MPNYQSSRCRWHIVGTVTSCSFNRTPLGSASHSDGGSDASFAPNPQNFKNVAMKGGVEFVTILTESQIFMGPR